MRSRNHHRSPLSPASAALSHSDLPGGQRGRSGETTSRSAETGQVSCLTESGPRGHWFAGVFMDGLEAPAVAVLAGLTLLFGRRYPGRRRRWWRVGGPGRARGRAGRLDIRSRTGGPARRAGRGPTPAARPAAGPAPTRRSPAPRRRPVAGRAPAGHGLPARRVPAPGRPGAPARWRSRPGAGRGPARPCPGPVATPRAGRAPRRARTVPGRPAGSNPAGISNDPGSTVAVSIRSSRNVRTSPLAESAPATYQRPEWPTIPYACTVRSLRLPSWAV
jgi:hypothetical protein